jgi:predicted 3-demethylubiquinone-9 3-methyltransferase (glyoxalase superfamily)
VPAWFHAGVVGGCGWRASDGDRVAEHAYAADRFAREIVGFLKAVPARSRQLNAKPLGEDPNKGGLSMSKVTPFLMFNDQLEAAMEFYSATFPDSEIRNVARAGEDGPISSAEFVVGGQRFMGYNGGSYFSFSEGVSLYVNCADQDEVDEYWDKLVKAGAKPTQCGWIKDPFGLSWQIVPRRFTELIGDRDPRKVKAVMEAMMTMVKLDVAELERAYNEA